MSRRPTDHELAAAREVADEVWKRGGRVPGVPLNEMLSAFGVVRFTQASRERLDEALTMAGVSADPSLRDAQRGDTITFTARDAAPVRKPAGVESAARPQFVHAQRGPVAAKSGKPWRKRKRVWALAAVLFFVLIMALSGDPETPKADPPPTPTTTPTPTPTPDPAALREAGIAEADDALEQDRYEDVLGAVAVLDDDDLLDGYKRRIARRLVKRARGALRSASYKTASTYARSARSFYAVPEAKTVMATAKTRLAEKRRAAALARDIRTCDSREKRTVRNGGGTPNGCTDYATTLAADRAAKAAARAAEEAANAVPDHTDDSSSGANPNWCGASRDGDGDGIWCEGE